MSARLTEVGESRSINGRTIQCKPDQSKVTHWALMHFTEEQLAFRDSIRRMVEKHVAPIAAEIDENDRFPEELIPIFGDMGLMQLWVPEKYGGPNGNLTMVCMAREEISRCPRLRDHWPGSTRCSSCRCCTSASRRAAPAVPADPRQGSDDVTAIAISEPQAGSDVSAMTHQRGA